MDSVLVGMGVGERGSQYEMSCLASYSRIAVGSAQFSERKAERPGRKLKEAEMPVRARPAKPVTAKLARQRMQRAGPSGDSTHPW